MAKGTSGYLKSKKQTLKELNELLGDDKDALAKEQEKMDTENEDRKGITDHIRNIFKK